MRDFILRAFAVGLAFCAGASLAAADSPRPLRLAQARTPCAAKNPCGARNPCAAKNPCGARNPCAAKNPCGANPCAAANPCGAKGGSAKDPVAQAAARQFKDWKKVNIEPVLSATHGNRYVFTYVNKKAESSALNGKFPFPVGAILVKESFEAEAGKPGAKGPIFVMEKRRKGYDAAHGDWHWAIVEPAGAVTMTGSGKEDSPTSFCAACHAAAKANDYIFGNGTTMKVKPTAMSAPAANPCAARNPCAVKNPCAGAKKP